MAFKNNPFTTFARILATMVRKGKCRLWKDGDSVWVNVENLFVKFSPNDNGIPTSTSGAMQVFKNGAGIREGGVWLHTEDRTKAVLKLYEDVIGSRLQQETPNYPNIPQPSVSRILNLFE